MKPKIFIVEDERIVAEDLRRNLVQLGYNVCNVASSGRDALKKIKADQPDLVLMDIVLRGQMNGIKAAGIIRNKYKIPVVYVTSHADDKTIEKAKVTVPYGYIIKPFNSRELQTTIEMACYKASMEKKLFESEAWLSTILKSIGDGVIVTDTKGQVTFVNQIVERMLGKKSKDLLRESIENILHIVDENSGEYLVNPIRLILEDSNITGDHVQAVLIGKNHKRIPISENASLIRDESGTITGAVLILHDMTERKKSEEALQESEKRYRKLFEDSKDAIFITTQKGELVIVNQSTLDMFGYRQGDIVHLGIQALFNDPKEWDQFKKEIEEKGSVRDYLVSMKKKKGEKIVCLLTATIRQSRENKVLGYQGLVRDITQQQKAEEEKESMQAQLMQAQKMEAVGILAGGIAHDFNNLLTVIQGNAEIAMLKLDPSNQIFEDLKEIQHAASRAADLTNQLLLFSRKQTMRFCILNFNQIVEDTFKILHRLIGEDIGIYTDLDPNLWSIRTDKGTMEQVIMNLAVNARDAMPRGGKLMIRTENIRVDDRICQKIPDARKGDFIRVIVTDEGAGIEPEIIQHIFEPFFSTKEKGSGTGLGLSVVYGIVKQHNGWIHVTSQPKRGTCFEIYLPTMSSESKDKNNAEMNGDLCYGNGERILVVEDEKGVLLFTKSALRKSKYQVITATNAKEAMKMFRKYKGQFDLVLSDVVLPDKTGIELIDAILAIQPDVKVLLCSGYTGKKSQWNKIQKKGYPFLHKPYGIQDLVSAVHEVLTTSLK